MRRLLLLLLAAPTLLCAQEQRPDGFLCATEQASGFAFENGRWVHARFNADEKFVISRAGPKEIVPESVWVIKNLGNDFPSFWCTSDFSDSGGLSCKGLGGEWRMNRKNGRFMKAYLVGYVFDSAARGPLFKEGANTPYIALGKCSAL